MTTLALKGILAGVDRIPDKWFEKIPYYQSEEAKAAQKAKKKSKKDKSSRRTHSTEDRYHREGRRPQDGRSRDDYSDDERRDRRRRSYDDDYDDDRRDRRREHRRRYDDDRYGRSNMDHDRFRHPTEPAIYDNPTQVPRMEQHRASVPANMGVPALDTASAAAAYDPHLRDPLRPNSSGPTGAYVPYSDIYQSPTNGNFSQDASYKAVYGSDHRNGHHSATNSPREYTPRSARSHKGRGRYSDEDSYDSDSYSSEGDRRRHRRHRARDRARSHEDGYGRSKGTRR